MARIPLCRSFLNSFRWAPLYRRTELMSLIDIIPGRLSFCSIEVWTRDRLFVIFDIVFALFHHSWTFTVGYGWSCEIIGFIVERLTGKTLEAYWYYYLPFFDGFFFHSPYTVKNIFLVLWEWQRPVSTWLLIWNRSLLGWHTGKTGNSRSGLLDLISLSKTQQSVCVMIHGDPTICNFPFHVVNVMFGGAGLYGSTKDFLTFLRHLLLVKGKQGMWRPFQSWLTTDKAGCANNPILSAETVASLFQPTLTEKAAASVGPWANSQWGVGLCLNCDDTPGGRRKGSGSCTFGFHYFESQICTDIWWCCKGMVGQGRTFS